MSEELRGFRPAIIEEHRRAGAGLLRLFEVAAESQGIAERLVGVGVHRIEFDGAASLLDHLLIERGCVGPVRRPLGVAPGELVMGVLRS